MFFHWKILFHWHWNLLGKNTCIFLIFWKRLKRGQLFLIWLLHYTIYHIWRNQNENKMLWTIRVILCLEFNLIWILFFYICYLFSACSEISRFLECQKVPLTRNYGFSSAQFPMHIHLLCKRDLIIYAFSHEGVILLPLVMVRPAASAHSMATCIFWCAACPWARHQLCDEGSSYHKDLWSEFTDGIRSKL